MKPNEIDETNAQQLWDKLYLFTSIGSEGELSNKPKYKVGDYVRMDKAKKVFDKGYMPNFTSEVFMVDQVKKGNVVNYRLVDSKGEEILGKFYNENLSKSIREPNNYYTIQKVLKTRTRAGKPEYFVKWKGLPLRLATWIRKSDVV